MTMAIKTYTAAEFLTAYEPSTLALMMDAERACREDTLKADKVAVAAGMAVTSDGRYPAAIWIVVWP